MKQQTKTASEIIQSDISKLAPRVTQRMYHDQELFWVEEKMPLPVSNRREVQRFCFEKWSVNQ